MSLATQTRPDATTAVAQLIRFLETGEVASGLFAAGPGAIRRSVHPGPGGVHVHRVDPTDRGFVIEFEQRGEDQGRPWSSRELIRADVIGATITEVVAYRADDDPRRDRAADA